MTSGIICCVCSTFEISVPQFLLKRLQKEYNKIQEQSELQRNRDQWSVLLQGLPRICHPRRQKARWREATEITILGVRVKRTSPDTENHDKNGYAKKYDDNNIFMTNVDNDNSDTTYTNMRNM